MVEHVAWRHTGGGTFCLLESVLPFDSESWVKRKKKGGECMGRLPKQVGK